MTKKPNEINDDEIRVISSLDLDKRKSRSWLIYALIAVAAVALAAIIFFAAWQNDEDEPEPEAETTVVEAPIVDAPKPETSEAAKACVAVIDTVIDKNGLLILTPENARPRLAIGDASLADSAIVLSTQAADVRGDNGRIVGTFILDGELISKGEAKAGFCAIINGELTIGVSDATPKLEQALSEDGYFFRQYPLVVGGQIVENKPKGRAIRKALAEIGGKVRVAISKDKLTFHDFSQLLIDAGATNAIYLVGSASNGFYVDDKGQRIQTGLQPTKKVEYVNYIIWE